MRRLRRQCFNLIELLTVCAMVVPLGAVVCRMGYQAMVSGRQFARQATDLQQVALVQREWLAVVHGSEPATWGTGGEAALFRAGDGRAVRLEAGRLVCERPERRLPLRLPPDTVVTVTLEPAARCAVLTLAWPHRLGGRTYTETVRLVAGAPPAGGTP